MIRGGGKRRYSSGRDEVAPRGLCAAVFLARLPAVRLRALHVLAPLALAAALSQGCAAAGVAVLGMAASTATKTGVSYTLDSRAHRTFTAPLPEVKVGLLAALKDMAFPVEADEKMEEGERVVARTNEREVEVHLEAVTPKATKMKVVVREGWFWKDRATAEEIVEQTARGVDPILVAAKAGIMTAAAVSCPVPADGELRLASATPVPWDPQRWSDGFAAAAPATGKKPVARAASLPVQKPAPAPAALPVPPAMVALGGARTPSGPANLPSPGGADPLPLSLLAMEVPPAPDGRIIGLDENRWRVLRDLRLRSCLAADCAAGPSLKRGEVVMRLRENERWWRVWLAGTDVVGWAPADDLAPQRWWDPPHAARATRPR